jgi:hypothetical protein
MRRAITGFLPDIANLNVEPNPAEIETQNAASHTEVSTRDRPTSSLREPNSSTLAWLQARTRRMKLAATESTIRDASASQNDTESAAFKKAGELLEHSETLISEINDFLFGDTRVDGEIKETMLDALSNLLDEIRVLTLKFDPAATVPASSPETILGADAEEAAGSAIEKLLIDKCLDILNLLPHLCNAMEWSKCTHDSPFDYHLDIQDRPLSQEELDEMLTHAALAYTIYVNSVETNLEQAEPLLTKTLPESWTSMAMPTEVKTSFEQACPKLQFLEDGRFYDPDSGLVAQLFVNESKKEVSIAFGGTTAGPHKGPLMARLLANPWIMARQWRANISSASGITVFGGPVPDSYIRAAELGALMKNHLAQDSDEWKISVTGHSKGGAEAEYAALKNLLPAFCFATPELGKAVLAAASEVELNAGAHNIRHYFVKGDLVPNIGTIVASILDRRQAHVGMTFCMDPDPIVGDGLLRALWCHDLFFASALYETAHQLNDFE